MDWNQRSCHERVVAPPSHLSNVRMSSDRWSLVCGEKRFSYSDIAGRLLPRRRPRPHPKKVPIVSGSVVASACLSSTLRLFERGGLYLVCLFQRWPMPRALTSGPPYRDCQTLYIRAYIVRCVRTVLRPACVRSCVDNHTGPSLVLTATGQPIPRSVLSEGELFGSGV